MKLDDKIQLNPPNIGIKYHHISHFKLFLEHNNRWVSFEKYLHTKAEIERALMAKNKTSRKTICTKIDFNQTLDWDTPFK